MKKYTPHLAFVAVATASVLFATGVGVANADPTFEVVGGRERIKITISQVEHNGCLFSVDGAIVEALYPEHNTLSFVVTATPGTHSVRVDCARENEVNREIGSKPVNVNAADPVLDAIDNALLATGSSAIATDPTLR